MDTVPVTKDCVVTANTRGAARRVTLPERSASLNVLLATLARAVALSAQEIMARLFAVAKGRVRRAKLGQDSARVFPAIGE